MPILSLPFLEKFPLAQVEREGGVVSPANLEIRMRARGDDRLSVSLCFTFNMPARLYESPAKVSPR